MQSGVNQFKDTLAHCRAITSFAHQLNSTGSYVLALEQRQIVTQAAFVRAYVAFEEFLEFSFGHYGMGQASTVGNKLMAYADAPSREHLHDMLTGTQRFVDWSTPSTVVKLARLYFENGEPYATAIGSAQSHLDDMKTVRNGASHVSRTTVAPLESLHLRWTGKPRIGASAYDVLMAQGVRRNGTTFMGFAESVLDGVVNQVANV